MADQVNGGRNGVEPAGFDLVTLGEAMAVVRGTHTGVLRPGFAAELSFAGAEATVAIGAARLGHSAAWCGRLGDDEVGEMIVTSLRGEGVDVSAVQREIGVPTGLMMRHRRIAGRVAVAYYRRGQAGSRLSAGDLPDAFIRSARVLHISGITPALAPTAARAVDGAVAVAREAGVTVSLDINHRASLWPPEEAGLVLRRLTAQADLVFAGAEEAALVLGSPADAAAENLATRLLRLGPAEAVIKLGADGALAARAGAVERCVAVRTAELDPVGAGDAFVAGYLSGLLDDLDLAARLRRGNLCGAFAVSSQGDWEGLPRRRDLGLLDARDNVVR